MKKIVFIVGQGGSGKTTLVKYFQKNPVNGWLFLDFDNGAISKPSTDNKITLKEWAESQKTFWINEVQKEKYRENVVLFGVNLFPWKVDLKNVKFGYLVCNQESRKDRLIKRGDKKLWLAHNKDVSEIAKKLDEAGAKPIETGSCAIEESAKNIKDWLLTL